MDKDLIYKITNAFIYSETLNDKNDYHHEIKNLIEIALRAISPGINDPNTAIICIRKISMILNLLFSIKSNYSVVEINKKSKIIYKMYTVEEELYYTFYQLIFYGKSDPSVAKAILNGVNLIYINTQGNYSSEVKKFYDYVYSVCLDSMNTELDKKHIESLKENFYEFVE
ncbi:putative membrane protein [Peptostreptococcus canis]|nr:putative membrane protein [Peptostreptococcus canis]